MTYRLDNFSEKKMSIFREIRVLFRLEKKSVFSFTGKIFDINVARFVAPSTSNHCATVFFFYFNDLFEF